MMNATVQKWMEEIENFDEEAKSPLVAKAKQTPPKQQKEEEFYPSSNQSSPIVLPKSIPKQKLEFSPPKASPKKEG